MLQSCCQCRIYQDSKKIQNSKRILVLDFGISGPLCGTSNQQEDSLKAPYVVNASKKPYTWLYHPSFWTGLLHHTPASYTTGVTTLAVSHHVLTSKGLSCKTSIATASQSVWNLLRAEPTQIPNIATCLYNCDWTLPMTMDRKSMLGLAVCISSGAKKTSLPSKQVINALYTATFLKILPGTGDSARYIMIHLRTLKTPKAPAKPGERSSGCMERSSKCCSTKSCAILVWVHWIQRSLFTVSSYIAVFVWKCVHDIPTVGNSPVVYYVGLNPRTM